MIVRKFLSPPNLTKTQIIHVHKMAKFVVIDKDKDFLFATNTAMF